MKLATLIPEYLAKVGISHVFGVNGANIEELFYEMHASKLLTPILAMHEANAITMAEGYFYKTGNIGVAITTSGGGAFNTLSPLTETLSSCIPLLLIVGQTPSSNEGRGAFQDSSGINTPINSVAIFSPVAIQVHKLTKEDNICLILDELIITSITKRGPVVLLIPADLFKNEVELLIEPKIIIKNNSAIDINLLAQIGDKIIESPKLVLIAGKDILHGNYRQEFAKFVEISGALVALTPDSKGLWDHYAENFVGLVGTMGHDSAFAAVKAAELIIGIGTSLPILSRLPTVNYMQNKTFISLHRLPSFVLPNEVEGLNVVDIICSPKYSLDFLSEYLLKYKIKRKAIRTQKPLPLTIFAESKYADNPIITMQQAIECLSSEIPKNADVFVDAGNAGAAATHYFMSRGVGIFNVALGMGAMGHSFGCAIGAAFVGKKRTYVVAGDGAFYMHGWEIHTAWQFQLPIVFLIFNNNAHAMCHVRESLFLGSNFGDNIFKTSNIGAGMQVLFPGLIGYDVSTELELHEALLSIHDVIGPVIISLTMSPEEMPPFRNFMVAAKSKHN